MKKSLSTLCLSSALFLGGIGLAFADSESAEPDTLSKDWYVAPFGSFLNTGGDTNAQDGWGAGLGIGKIVNQRFNIELRGLWHNYNNNYSCCGGAQTDLVGAAADLQYYFQRDTFSPYAVASVGGVTTQMKGPAFSLDQESFIFEAGMGSSYSVYKNFMLRGDVRYRLNTLPSSLGNGGGVLNDAVVNLGFVVPVTF